MVLGLAKWKLINYYYWMECGMGNIKIAYLLLVHNCPEQVNKFVEQIVNYGDADVYIHVDKKNKSMSEHITKSSKIHVYSEYDVSWASFEIVRAAYFLISKSIESGVNYSHIYFGSGQDLLVKRGLYEYLANKPNKIFMKMYGEITNKDRQSARYRVRWPKWLMVRDDWSIQRIVRIIIQLLCTVGIVVFPNKTLLDKKVKFFYGGTWFIAPFDVAVYINDYINNHPDFVEFWESSLASDLMFFQTIIMNSKYKDYVEDELMYVRFGKSFGTMNHPMDITVDDDIRIEEGDYYCARKFNYKDKYSIDYYINKCKFE